MYRLYVINEKGYLHGPPIEYEASRDEEAVGHAKQLLDGKDIEIWQAARLVAYLTHDKKN